MAATALTSGPHAGRFHVSVFNDTGELAGPRAEQQGEEFGFEVGLLDSLPWSRGHRQQALPDSAGLGEQAGQAGETQEAVGDPMDTLTSAQEGATLTARMAKSLSQLRLSNSGSSANVRSPACDCCAGASSPDAIACDVVPDEADCPQHLEPPWSHNSCSWSRRSLCSRECSSSASLHQQAAAHRSERVACRAVRCRASLANCGGSGHCLPQSGDYLAELQDRVQLWLSQVECEPLEGAKFFLGHPDS